MCGTERVCERGSPAGGMPAEHGPEGRVRLGSAGGLVVWGGAHLSIASSHVEDLV